MKRVDLPQGSLHYRDVGEGPVLLFVHGLFVDGSLWDGVVARLSPTHRCLVLEMPLGSHTLPMAPNADLSPPGVARLVADFMEALDLRDVTLVGNDSGGAVCQLVAARHGARLGRLVLTNCDALDMFPPPGFGYLAWGPRIPGFLFLLVRAMWHLGVLRRSSMAYGALSVKPIDDDRLRAWLEPSVRSRGIRGDARKFLLGISAELTLTAAREIATTGLPVLLAWGSRDHIFPLSVAERLREALGNARLEPIAGARAFTPIDAPAGVAEAILGFVEPARAHDGAVLVSKSRGSSRP